MERAMNFKIFPAPLNGFSAGNTARGVGQGRGLANRPSRSGFADDQGAASSISESGDTYRTCGFRLSAGAEGDGQGQVDPQTSELILTSSCR